MRRPSTCTHAFQDCPLGHQLRRAIEKVFKLCWEGERRPEDVLLRANCALTQNFTAAINFSSGARQLAPEEKLIPNVMAYRYTSDRTIMRIFRHRKFVNCLLAEQLFALKLCPDPSGDQICLQFSAPKWTFSLALQSLAPLDRFMNRGRYRREQRCAYNMVELIPIVWARASLRQHMPEASRYVVRTYENNNQSR